MTIREPMTAGTSSTRLFLLDAQDGLPRVLKLLVHRAGAVDGHDEATFSLKPKQIEHLADITPALANRYVPIEDQLVAPDWTAHLMPYQRGDDLLQPLRAGDRRSWHAQVSDVVGTLARDGYASANYACPQDHVEQTHLERIRRRLPLLADIIPDIALSGDGIEICGRHCRSAVSLLAWLRSSTLVLDHLRPYRLAPPVHGDLNSRNVIVDGARFYLIDPRGTLAPLDPVYDLAKLLLSLSLWDASLRHGFAVEVHGAAAQIAVAGAPKTYADAVRSFVDLLGSVEPLAELLAGTGDWRTRLLFVHAVHAVSEAACRRSDALAQGADDSGAVLGFFFAGLLLLEDVCQGLSGGGIDIDAHLTLIAGLSNA